MQTILTNCTVIDGTGRAPRDGMSVVVEDDKITGVSAGSADGAGARVLDLEGGYVLPGLWEASSVRARNSHRFEMAAASGP